MESTSLSFDEFVATLPTKRCRPTVAIRHGVKPPKSRKSRRSIRPPMSSLSPAADYMLGDPCAYCGEPASQFDHIEPLIRGGAHDAGNVARACWPCNREKNMQPLVVFLARRAA